MPRRGCIKPPHFLAAAVLSCLCVCVSPVAADVKVVDGFAAALADSTAAKRPLAVLVHGSSWQGASRRLAETVWRAEAFRTGLRESFTLTEIAVDQNADEASRKAIGDATKGWDPATVTTFPAVQIYGTDGHLLRSFAGRDLRDIATAPESLAKAIDAVGAASRERDRLRVDIVATAGRRGDVAPLLDALGALDVRPEKDAAKRFRELDPNDRSGWVARLSFTGWDFIRGISERVAKGEAQAALDEVEGLLVDEHYEPRQRCLLLAAKGMLLATLDRTEEAWRAYLLAHAWDPEGVNGKAVIAHARRTVGGSLRIAPLADTATDEAARMSNLTRDRAVLRVVPSDPGHDTPANHRSLFSGPMKEFAFHSANAVGPHVIIDLRDTCRIDVVQVVNRQSHPDRAAGLTLWLSADGTAWRQVWQADRVAEEWTIDLRADGRDSSESRFLKVGLPTDREGVLHLRAVNVFGRRPGDTPPASELIAQASGNGPLPTNTSVTMEFDPSRIDMRAVAAYARTIARAEGGDIGTANAAEAAEAVIKYDRPIVWRSVRGERVTGTVVVITPTMVTIEHDGQRTEVPRDQFSPGSQTVLSTIESRVREFFTSAAARKPVASRAGPQ